MATTEVRDLATAARAALADGRVHDALTCYASATRSARTQLPPHAPERIALAAEHAQAVFDHRSDPESALEIARTAYDEAVEAIDDAGEHAAAVRELALLRDQMTFWGLPHGGLTGGHSRVNQEGPANEGPVCDAQAAPSRRCPRARVPRPEAAGAPSGGTTWTPQPRGTLLRRTL